MQKCYFWFMFTLGSWICCACFFCLFIVHFHVANEVVTTSLQSIPRALNDCDHCMLGVLDILNLSEEVVCVVICPLNAVCFLYSFSTSILAVSSAFYTLLLCSVICCSIVLFWLCQDSQISCLLQLIDYTSLLYLMFS